MMSGEAPQQVQIGHLSAERFRKTRLDFKRRAKKFANARVKGFRKFLRRKNDFFEHPSCNEIGVFYLVSRRTSVRCRAPQSGPGKPGAG
jgi:hypothetical protein